MLGVRCWVLGAIALALVLPRGSAAQTPAERAQLDSVRASFETMSDSLVLIRRERERIAVARVNRDDPFIHMELGYLSYRLGEITTTTKRYEDAASEFQWATDLRPQWAYAWYYRGLAELLTGEASMILIENIRQILGHDALSQAVRSFAHAVEVDPSFSQGLVELANAAMRQRLAPRLEVARAALRQAASTPAGRKPEVQLVRGRIERRLGDADSALAAFESYVAIGGDSAVGGIEVARTQALLGRKDSTVVWYYRALNHPLGDPARREVLRDLRWIATPAELAAFDRTPPESVGLFVRRFWDARDIEDGRRIGERLSEQFRRYQYSMQNFHLITPRRGFNIAFAFSDTSQKEFDDRGVVYMRHGEPTRRATYAGTGIEPNESWMYRRTPPASDLVLHFAAINDISDYRLIESLSQVCQRGFTADGLTVSEMQVAAGASQCLQSRDGFGEPYDRMAHGVPTANAWANERSVTRAMTREAVTTDSYAHRFANELSPVVSWFAVADDQGRPELHLVFAVPAHRLHPVDAAGAVAYPLSLRLLVYDSASGRLIAALDTTRTFRAAQRLGAGSFVTEQLVVRVPAGHFNYAFVIEEEHAGAGDALSRQSLDVPRMDGGFSASDVVMGREGSGLAWRRADGIVPLNPLMSFPKGGVASLFYEVYGLPQGSSIQTRVRIVRAGGRSIFRRLFGGAGGADLSYTTVTDAPQRSRIRQQLDLRGLSAGRYTLRVELTGPSGGETVVRESPFEIQG